MQYDHNGDILELLTDNIKEELFIVMDEDAEDCIDTDDNDIDFDMQ